MDIIKKYKYKLLDSARDEHQYQTFCDLLNELKKDYQEHRAECYEEVCAELQKTIEIARKKKKQLLPI